LPGCIVGSLEALNLLRRQGPLYFSVRVALTVGLIELCTLEWK